MRKEKAIRKEIEIPMFNWRVIICNESADSHREFLIKNNALARDVFHTAKTTADLDNSVCYVWLSPFKKIDEFTISSVVHELVHVTWYLQEARGALFNNDVQEPQAYLITYLLWEFFKEFK